MNSRVTQRSSEGYEEIESIPEAPAARQRFPQWERDEEDRDLHKAASKKSEATEKHEI